MTEKAALKLAESLDRNTEAMKLVVATANFWGDRIATALPVVGMHVAGICMNVEKTVNTLAGRRIVQFPKFLKGAS